MAKKIDKVEKKALTLDILNETYSEEFSTQEVVVKVRDSEYVVLVDKKFRLEKIQIMFNEMIQKQAIRPMSENEMMMYMFFLMIKYFTDLEACQGEKDYDEQMHIFNILVELEIITPIMMAFDPNEVSKFSDFSKNLTENIKELTKKIEDDNNVKGEEVAESESK